MNDIHVFDHDMDKCFKAASDKNDNTVFGWANASTPENKALQYSDFKLVDPQQDTRAQNVKWKSVLVEIWSVIFGQ